MPGYIVVKGAEQIVYDWEQLSSHHLYIGKRGFFLRISQLKKTFWRRLPRGCGILPQDPHETRARRKNAAQ
jgi:hypothetical protein